MREFIVILCVSVCLIGACNRDSVQTEEQEAYPKEVYNDVNLGSIVMVNDSIVVVFAKTGLDKSEAKIVNIIEIDNQKNE